MASFAEVKANAAYFLAREVGERLVKPTPLYLNHEMSLEKTRSLIDFRERANGFYSVYFFEGRPEKEAEALINLAQELINLGSFRQARRLLTFEPPKFLNRLPEIIYYYQARVKEKFGWIADYEGGFTESSVHFSMARNLLNVIPRWQWRREEEDLYSTTTHFLGRAHYGMALQGINRQVHTQAAVEYFEEDLSRFVTLREAGIPNPANEGFQHAWLGRCYLLGGQLDRSSDQIEQAGKLFREHTSLHPESGIMAHYWLLRGRINLEADRIEDAKANFSEVIRIREENEYYPKGLADAYAGLSKAYWREGKQVEALKFLTKSVRAYPFVVLGGISGG